MSDEPSTRAEYLETDSLQLIVIPAKAEIQERDSGRKLIPAFAGMTT